MTATGAERVTTEATLKKSSRVYDEQFLGTPVAVPSGGTAQWDYTHFSLAMSASRRLAQWVAWNIDGMSLFPSDSIPRADDFRLDPRLPDDAQTGDDVYAGNDLDADTSPDGRTCCGAPSTRRERPTTTRSSSPTSPRR